MVSRISLSSFFTTGCRPGIASSIQSAITLWLSAASGGFLPLVPFGAGFLAMGRPPSRYPSTMLRARRSPWCHACARGGRALRSPDRRRMRPPQRHRLEEVERLDVEGIGADLLAQDHVRVRGQRIGHDLAAAGVDVVD